MKDKAKEAQELRKTLHETVDKLPDEAIFRMYRLMYPALLAFFQKDKGGKA